LIFREGDSYNAPGFNNGGEKASAHACATSIQQEKISQGRSAGPFYEASISAATFEVVWRAWSGSTLA
jgi:hypothetical protein